jgi:Raf kinase inhibitor-like YbhB/YbcL family protein
MAAKPRDATVPQVFATFTMKLTSPAFNRGDPLARHFAKEHGNVSPPLTFSDVPKETQSLALIMNDPDAPHGTFTHWVLFNIPPKTAGLQENEIPAGAVPGKNDYGDIGYGGPRPPSGTHRYFFHAYALDTLLNLSAGASAADVEQAMETHVIENAELMGRFSAEA